MAIPGVPTYDSIVLSTLSEVDLLLKEYVYQGYHVVSGFLRAPLAVVAAIYLVILGYSVAMGWLRLQVSELVKVCFKIGLIYTAVTEWGWVSEYVVGFINNVINDLGDVLIQASPTRIPGVDGIDGAMQEVLIEFTKLGSLIFRTGGFTNIGGWIDGLIVWGFGYVLVAIALFELILSKVLLAILFIFTPLIAMFCFFKPLQGVFDRWLGAIVGSALLQLFVICALTFGLSLSFWWVDLHVAENALQIGNFGTLPIIIVGFISIGLIFKAAQLAYGIGADAMRASSNGLLAGAVGGMVGGLMSRAIPGGSGKGEGAAGWWPMFGEMPSGGQSAMGQLRQLRQGGG